MVILFKVAVFVIVLWTLVWAGRRGPFARASWQPASDQGLAYRHAEMTDRRGRCMRLLLAFDVPSIPRFAMRRENWWDRLAKRIGLVQELQLDHCAFDQRYYIEEHSPCFARLLREQQQLGKLLATFAVRLQMRSAPLGWMEGGDGELLLEIRIAGDYPLARTREEILAWLQPFIAALSTLPRTATGLSLGRLERLPRRIALSLLCVGLLAATAIGTLGGDRLIDTAPLLRMGTWAGLCGFGAFLLWALRYVGASARRHRLLLEWLLMGLPGCILLAIVAIHQINWRLDFAAPGLIVVSDVSLQERHKRRAGTVYYLHFRSTDSRLRSGRLRLDSSSYDRLRTRWGGGTTDRAEIHWRGGVLGMAWIEVAG